MKSLWSAFIRLLLLAVVGGALLATIAILALDRQLPSLDALADFRRTPDYVSLSRYPRDLIDAVVAIEDERFYVHDGIDYIGVLRAGLANLSDDLSQGASTITMQVARNFYLSRDKTYTRKLYEVLLSYRIEKAFSKDEILELYMNKIYLGQGAYGFADAARTYFGKSLNQLSLAECAMLAGLPKAPSANNPVANPRRARQRQAYILRRMLELGRISHPEYDGALLEPLRLK
ncbi:transglycosylase domain-containing protein [Cupriavidus necator]|uniref:transglycosylase domain-containing protein n=1 Tax=Cupriavidus necator TaxID=106590 RepID=UPI00339D57AE